MEFEPYRAGGMESQDEEKEVVSLRYFLTENSGISEKRESSTSNRHDAFFEFSISNSTSYKFCPAEEEIFYQDCIFSQSSQRFYSNKTRSEHKNPRLLHQNPGAWRTDSLSRQPSFISSNFQKRGFHSSSETFFQRRKLKFQSDRRAKPLNLAHKTRLKWLQFLRGGLIKTPPLNLQEWNLKREKPKNSVFKRSVSEEGLVTQGKELREVNYEEKSMSVKESIMSKGLKICTPFIKCLIVRKRGSVEGNKKDPNSGKSKNGGARVHPSRALSDPKRSSWNFPKLVLELFWPKCFGETS